MTLFLHHGATNHHQVGCKEHDLRLLSETETANVCIFAKLFAIPLVRDYEQVIVPTFAAKIHWSKLSLQNVQDLNAS